MAKIKIYAYMGPIPENWNDFRVPGYKNDNFMTDEQYQFMKDAGFNGVIALMERTAEHAELGLSLSDKFGLDYYVRDEINWNVDYDPTVFERKADFYRACEKHPSFAGIFITDEPDCQTYPQIAELKKAFDKFFNGKKDGFYVNLLPTYANDVTQLGAPYPEYIERYIIEVNPDHVCFDHYPFEKKKVGEGEDDYEDYTRKDFFYNLDVVAKACDKYGKDMWSFVQAKNYCKRKTEISYEGLSFQIYAHLAFGAKAIVYYTYWSWPGLTNDEDMSKHVLSLISPTGKRLEQYYHAKDVHADVDAFSEIYMDYKHLDTYVVAPNDDCYFVKIDFKKSDVFTADAPLLVGEFIKDGKKAYLVVNATDPYEYIDCAVKVKLEKATCYLSRNKFNISKTMDLVLKPGQGVFITED